MVENLSTTGARNGIDALSVTHVTAAAEVLAGLLNDSPEFQEYLRLAHAVRGNADAQDVLRQLNGYAPAEGSWRSAAELQARLEALPVMQAYQQAEIRLFALVRDIEEAIRESAGFAFAEHARPDACG